MIDKNKKILILGAAGLIGRSLTDFLSFQGLNVCVVDQKAIKTKLPDVIYHQFDILQSDILGQLISEYQYIIDCIGLTSHHIGLKDPELDLKNNLLPQIKIINALREHGKGKKLIYMGSRTQYGKATLEKDFVDENDPQWPIDPQGIHKQAAESYYRIYCGIYGFECISLRIANCFGPYQKLEGEDLGLIGGFIKKAINKQSLSVFSKNLIRQFVYAKDLCPIVEKALSAKNLSSFETFNIAGDAISVYDLAQKIVNQIGTGEVILSDLGDSKRNVDVGNLLMSTKKWENKFSKINYTNFDQALEKTIAYFQSNP